MPAFISHDVVREDRPDRVLLAERSGQGWREVHYADALQQIRSLASALLGRGLGPETPIVIISGNSVDHGLLALAAQYVGVPIVPLAEQYSLVPDAYPRLQYAVETVRPKMVFADGGAAR